MSSVSRGRPSAAAGLLLWYSQPLAPRLQRPTPPQAPWQACCPAAAPCSPQQTPQLVPSLCNCHPCPTPAGAAHLAGGGVQHVVALACGAGQRVHKVTLPAGAVVIQTVLEHTLRRKHGQPEIAGVSRVGMAGSQEANRVARAAGRCTAAVPLRASWSAPATSSAGPNMQAATHLPAEQQAHARQPSLHGCKHCAATAHLVVHHLVAELAGGTLEGAAVRAGGAAGHHITAVLGAALQHKREMHVVGRMGSMCILVCVRLLGR